MMNELKIVVSTAGKDKGGYFAVIAAEGACFFICNGKERPVERPKKKNARHVRITDDSLLLEGITNKALRKALTSYAAAQQDHRS